jgi:hypothetical protein
MTNLEKVENLVKMTGGKFVSTQRQIKNETYAFEFPSKPNKQYVIYKRGYVRCLTRNKTALSITPLIFSKSVKNEHGYYSKHTILVSLDAGIEYLRKRFS